MNLDADTSYCISTYLCSSWHSNCTYQITYQESVLGNYGVVVPLWKPFISPGKKTVRKRNLWSVTILTRNVNGAMLSLCCEFERAVIRDKKKSWPGKRWDKNNDNIHQTQHWLCWNLGSTELISVLPRTCVLSMGLVVIVIMSLGYQKNVTAVIKQPFWPDTCPKAHEWTYTRELKHVVASSSILKTNLYLIPKY